MNHTVARLDFLHREFATLSIVAAFATRDRKWPIYTKQATSEDRAKVQAWVRLQLRERAFAYATTPISAEAHVLNISALSKDTTAHFGMVLFEQRLRFGVTQKLLNLYLKYLWLAELTAMPPHCPIDGQIREEANLNYQWTRSDSQQEYEFAIAELEAKCPGKSLAEWELVAFEGRRK